MALLVVRHARAGSRRRWDGPDLARPLTSRGRKQATALVQVLGPYKPERILSSPYARCVETVAPLAEHLGLTVEPAAALSEGAGGREVVALARAASNSTTVVSTHGDVVLALFDALVRVDGLALPADPPAAKGSTWVLAERGGRFAEAHYLPPPA